MSFLLIRCRQHALRLIITQPLCHEVPQRYIREEATQLQLSFSALPRIHHQLAHNYRGREPTNRHIDFRKSVFTFGFAAQPNIDHLGAM
jgi:hypothetical protein